MINKIKCFFGFHDYEAESGSEVELCNNCGKRLLKITLMRYEDAKKAGFTDEQMKKGFVYPNELDDR